MGNVIYLTYTYIYICPNTKCTAPRMNPSVNHGLWVVVMRPYGFLTCQRRPILMSNVDNGDACVDREYMENPTNAPLNFVVTLKLKKKKQLRCNFFKKKE